MILEAQKEFDIDLSQSILVGDKLSDMEAGLFAGVAKNYLITGDPSYPVDVECSKITKLSQLLTPAYLK
jgi:histidinol phosphatase-like enzyme